MDIRRSRFIFLLLLAALTLVPPPARAEPPDWQQLGQERQSLEESAGQALKSEQETVAEIFRLNRTLEETQAAIARLEKQIGEVARQQENAQAERDKLDSQRKERQRQFGVRVRYYAENGSFAPIGFLITSHSFSDFLFRINILTQVMERDARLIREIRSLTAAVEAQEKLLADQKAQLQDLNTKQSAEAAKLTSQIAEKETILAGLREQRSVVEGRVAELETVWTTEARPVLEEFGKRLQTVALKVKDLSPDSVQLSIAPPGATVRVSEARLNDFLQREAELKGLQFRLVPGHTNLEGSFSGVKVSIIGQFTIKSKTVVRYEPGEIRFQDFALPPSVLDELLAAGRLDIDYGSLIGPWSVKEITADDGFLVLKAGMR